MEPIQAGKYLLTFHGSDDRLFIYVDGSTLLLTSLYKDLQLDWNRRHTELQNLGYLVSDRGVSPEFTSQEEALRFALWAKEKLEKRDMAEQYPQRIPALRVGGIATLNGANWKVSGSQDKYYLYGSINHDSQTRSLFYDLGAKVGQDRADFLQAELGITAYSGAFPEMSLGDLNKFYNYAKIKLNEVPTVEAADLGRTPGIKGAVRSGTIQAPDRAAYCGNPIKIGRVKGKVVTSQSSVSAISL